MRKYLKHAELCIFDKEYNQALIKIKRHEVTRADTYSS